MGLGSQQSPSQAPQSGAHVAQSSPASGSQMSSPHTGQYCPQSLWASATHWGSQPAMQQNGSRAQVQSVTPKSSQPGVGSGAQQSPPHAPQSSGQPLQLSPSCGSQIPSPQPAQTSPHWNTATFTHVLSQNRSQQ